MGFSGLEALEKVCSLSPTSSLFLPPHSFLENIPVLIYAHPKSTPKEEQQEGEVLEPVA